MHVESAAAYIPWQPSLISNSLYLQGRCEQLEKEVEWVKSERDEAQKAAEGSAARLKELETAASRQKGHRRDESKRSAKESKAANHRAEVAHPLHMHASAL